MTIFEQTVTRSRRTSATGALVSSEARCILGRPAISASISLHVAARWTSRSVQSGSQKGMRWKSSTPCHRSSVPMTTRAGDRPSSSSSSSSEDRPDELEGSGAREALHQHVAVHEVRRGEPVPDDRGPGRGRLPNILRAIREDSRGPPTCQVLASRPGRACSRTRCSSPPSRATTSRWDRPPCRSTGLSCLHRGRARASLRRPPGQDRRHPGDGVQVGIRDTRASLSYKLRKLLSWAGARSSARIRTSLTIGSQPWSV